MTVFIHPTSANAMYRMLHGRVTISAEGREFKKNMANLLHNTPHGYCTGPVKLTLQFEFMTNRKRDLDNYAKPLIDTLKGVLFVDDSDIYILNMTKRIGAAVDCVRIECEPIYEDD
jgi:Holliday junction resolvase RusA-like endonuclease